jgi:hypothetical protein
LSRRVFSTFNLQTLLAGRGNVSEIINQLEGLKAQLHEWLELMSEDPHFAPPGWVMESMWTRLNRVIALVEVIQESDAR